MHLTSYRFTGDQDELAAAYDRMFASYPLDSLLFHACALVDDGIVIIDACPSKQDFEAFSTSPEFLHAIDEAGLPRPTIEPFGTVHAARTAAGSLVT